MVVKWLLDIACSDLLPGSILASGCHTETEAAEVMKNLPNLSGEVITETGPVPVSGPDFWRSGPDGVASQFSGDAGRKRLSVLIRQLLPSRQTS